MNKTWIVYIHISPSNKYYVGITCQKKAEYRWGVNGIKYRNNKYFWNAIQKYGWENFKHIIVVEGVCEATAKSLEVSLIEKYKSNQHNHGYNHTAGGDGTVGYKHKQESIIKMKSKIISDETKAKLSQSAKKRVGDKNSFFNRHHSIEVIEHLKNCKCGIYDGKNNPMAKSIDQYSLDDVYIQSFWGAKEAQDLLGISRSHISQCCNGKRKTAGGYKWKFSKGVN